jgi:hypothetical protein
MLVTSVDKKKMRIVGMEFCLQVRVGSRGGANMQRAVLQGTVFQNCHQSHCICMSRCMS